MARGNTHQNCNSHFVFSIKIEAKWPKRSKKKVHRDSDGMLSELLIGLLFHPVFHAIWVHIGTRWPL